MHLTAGCTAHTRVTLKSKWQTSTEYEGDSGTTVLNYGSASTAALDITTTREACSKGRGNGIVWSMSVLKLRMCAERPQKAYAMT